LKSEINFRLFLESIAVNSVGNLRSSETKDMGEISPKEFAQFIGKEMRLRKIAYAPKVESGPIFTF